MCVGSDCMSVQHIRRGKQAAVLVTRGELGTCDYVKRPHLGKSLQDTAGTRGSAEGTSPRKARMQPRVTKQNINNVLNNKGKTHNFSLNNTELISKCKEIDDR